MDNSTRTCLIAYLYLKLKKEKRKRNIWVKPLNKRRNEQGDGENLIRELHTDSVEAFNNYFRMSPQQFQQLLAVVGPDITKMHWICEPISAESRLAITLRYLATGDSMVSLAFSYRCGKATISIIIRECLTVIWAKLSTIVFPQPTEQLWRKIARGYWDKWNFPNCIGSIDGKHVVIEAPRDSGSSFFNYKGHHSIILLATCDSNYKFTTVDIGAAGRLSDGGVFKNSVLGKKLENGTLNIPPPCHLPFDGPVAPFVFVGDEAFQLTKYMMRPYPRRIALDNEKRIFNYRLSRARRVIENAFGILVAKWRILKRPINTSLETLDAIVKATVCLHNFLKEAEEKVPVQNRMYHTINLTDVGDESNGLWRTHTVDNSMYSISNTGSNTHSTFATNIRDTYARYFMNDGAVEWQWNRLND